MPALRVAFFGTPEFAVPTLSRLIDAGFPVVAAVTQPDRPRGRGQKASAGPVKSLAVERGIPVLQPERLRHEDFLGALGETAPDIGVVAAYGKILPEPVLTLPRLGLVNVHASLLPRWRGASPVHRAVMAGDPETGVSIMRIVKALDAGAVFAMARRAIGPEETADVVERDLAVLGADLLLDVLASIERGDATETPQDPAGVTYAPLLTKEEGRLDWSQPAVTLHNRIRGLHPWPHAFTFLDGARVIVLRSRPPEPAAVSHGAPGEVLGIDRDHVEVATGGGTLRLSQLQAEGRRALPAREFAAGARLAPGARFGS
ncbi:MAG: methionyl-tRNA formyltransferase [Acidobacteria bacterium]|nr:MAG: methionyl-tRNA formyltransferase [Acidobacteriota bacterium]